MAKADAAARPLNRSVAAKPSKNKNKKPGKPTKSDNPGKSDKAGKSDKKEKKPRPAKSASKAKSHAGAISPKPASQKPVELYFWPTPNGWKIAIMLEECGLPYEIRPVNIGRGDQFQPSFLAIAPNNRIPAIIDPDGPGGEPISVFESGAILQYLGRKTGKFYPADERQRVTVDEWLFWQVGGLGPMTGQAAHFRNFQKSNTYAIERYSNEVHRLLGVMNSRLANHPYLTGEYSIADIACIGWTIAASRIDNMLNDFPHVKDWLERVRTRPAVAKGLETGKELREAQAKDPRAMELARKVLFGQRGK